MVMLNILKLTNWLEKQHYKPNLCFARNKIIHSLVIKNFMSAKKILSGGTDLARIKQNNLADLE